jgi:hypothetical protein
MQARQLRNILIAVETTAFARWTLWLADRFSKEPGCRLFLRLVEPTAPASSALPTLLSLEKMLVRKHQPGGADRLEREALQGKFAEPAGLRPDVVIDLTDNGIAIDAQAVRLRPLYDGQPGQTALASALFFRGTPAIVIERIEPGQATGRVVASGTASLEAAAGIGGGIEAVASRTITLLLKALSDPEDAPAVTPSLPIRQVRGRNIAVRTAKDVARAAVRAAYRLCCHGSHWRIGWRFVETGNDVWSRRDLAGVRWNVLPDPVDHFYADPFPLRWQGKDYLFFEDLDHKTEKGIIAVVAFDQDGRPGPAMPVIEEPWHLSYPFLIERDGDIFMIPESSGNRDIPLYRAVDFPLKWERVATLVDGVEAADATIVEQDGLLYLFAVVRDGVGGYSDTLAIWWADNLFGPWRPHERNPVLVDDRTARPAGNFARIDGALYRPVQDCRRAYGAGLGLMKVTRLDREGFAQQPDGLLEAGDPWPGKRIHTLNYNGRLEAIDGFTLRPRLKPAADLVDWWYRPKG